MWKVKFSKTPLLRAVAVIGVVGLIVSGVTFAALRSQQVTLTGNTIQSATAGLEIGTSAANFAASQPGFQFADVIPGGPAMPESGNTFYLENSGTAPLQVSLNIPAAPENDSNISLADISLQITRTDVDGSQTQTASLQSLLDSGLVLTDPLAPGTTGQYTVKVSMTADAFDGSSASIGAFDFVFSGTVPTN